MLSKRKLINQVSKLGGNYEFKLHNITINGDKKGCSGFIRNIDNGNVVYVNTEKPCYLSLSKQNLVRFAKDMSDYGSSHSINEWATDDMINEKIATMLNNTEKYKSWQSDISN